jgi:hypothetical protein
MYFISLIVISTAALSGSAPVLLEPHFDTLTTRNVFVPEKNVTEAQEPEYPRHANLS